MWFCSFIEWPKVFTINSVENTESRIDFFPHRLRISSLPQSFIHLLHRLSLLLGNLLSPRARSKIAPTFAAFPAAMELRRFWPLLLALALPLLHNSQALVLTVQNTECVWEDVEYDGDIITGNFVVLDHEIFWGADHPGIELVVGERLTFVSLYISLPCVLMVRSLFLCLGLASGEPRCPRLSVALLFVVSVWSVLFVNQAWGSTRRWSASKTTL